MKQIFLPYSPETEKTLKSSVIDIRRVPKAELSGIAMAIPSLSLLCISNDLAKTFNYADEFNFIEYLFILSMGNTVSSPGLTHSVLYLQALIASTSNGHSAPCCMIGRVAHPRAAFVASQYGALYGE